MEEILACRVCLATDVKLFDVFSNKLVSAYEMITGVQMSVSESLPRAVCVYCGAALRKMAAFAQRCLRAQQLLEYLASEEQITTDLLRHIDRTNYPPQPFLAIETAYSESKDEIKEEHTIDNNEDVDLGIDHPESKDKMKKEHTIDYNEDADLGIDNDQDCIDNDIKSEASDDEPLSKKIEKKNGVCEPPLIKEEFKSAPEIDLMFLSKEEQIEELRKRMDSLNYINSLYKCEFCYRGFMTDVTYKNHMLRHDPKAGKYPCEICNIFCASPRALKGHAATTHARRYVCRLCDYVTKSGSRAREHSRWHSGHTYVCQLCGASFAKSTSYLTHVRLRHPSKHCCALCGDSFIGQNGLNMHMKKAHRLQEEAPPARCGQCGAEFRGHDALETHRQLNDCHAGHRPCAQCGQSFPSHDALRDHGDSAHAGGPARCDECDKTFSCERSFAIHRRRMHLGLRLPRPAATRRRATVVCEHCGKACHSKANLVSHQRTHSGERPFACATCDKAFTNPQLLQVHTRTHSGERPCACAACGKRFVHKAALNRHARVHTGEKPYACAHCGKAFSQSNSMKLHVRTVHLKLPAPYRARKKDAPVA